jgi:hypothetical protein
MKAILNEAASMGLQKNLEPILEENESKGLEIVPYKPNQSLADQRKIKNEELKKKVKLMSAIGAADTISQISSVSSRDERFFITGAKVNRARFENK